MVVRYVLGQGRRAHCRGLVSAVIVPVVAIHTFIVCFAAWCTVISFKDLGYDNIESVIVDAETPAFVAYRVIHATLPSMALTFERVASNGTCREVSVACTHKDRVSCIAYMESGGVRRDEETEPLRS